MTDHRPDPCADCGHQLGAGVAGDVIGEYDLIDVAPFIPVVDRHRRIWAVCPCCGSRTKAPLPAAASATPFGPNIQTLVFYLKHFQHLPYHRLETLLDDVCGLKISQGALCNMLRRDGAASEDAQGDGTGAPAPGSGSGQ